jgi:hypothetical protein
MATTRAKKRAELPPAPSNFDRRAMEIAKRADPKLRAYIEELRAYIEGWDPNQKKSVLYELVKAGCSPSAVLTLYLDYSDLRQPKELRRWRKQVVTAHRRLVAAYDALKTIADVDEELSSLLAIELQQTSSNRRQSRHLKLELLLQKRIKELALIAAKLKAPRGAPRKLSRDFFMIEFIRRVAPPGRTLDHLALKLYTELSNEHITLESYLSKRYLVFRHLNIENL